MPRPHRHTRRVWLRGTGLLPERWRASAVLAPIFLFVFGHPSIPLLAVPRPPPVVIPTSTTPLPPPLVAILDPVCVAATQLLRPPYLDTLACFPGRSPPPLRLHIIRKLGPVSRQLILLNPGRFQGCHALSLVGCLCLALHSILVGGFPPSPPPQKASGRKQTFPYWPARQPWGLLSLVFPSPGRPWTSVRPTSSAIQDDCGTGQPPQDTVDELLGPWTDSPVSCFQCPPPSVAGPRRYRPLRAPTRCLSVCLPPLTKPRRSSFPTLIPSAVRLHPPFNAPLSPIPAHRGSVTQLIYPCPYLVPLSPLSR